MIRRLTLENFMAHARTELVLGPGLTALTGPNNVGKSAVVEALRCLTLNPAPRHVIRHGAKEARVSLELSDGTRVVWIRKKASAGYELWRPGAEAPEEFWKLGKGGVPEEVRDALRLDLVDLEARDKAIDVHLGDQRSPVFLLDEPSSVMAEFFAASSESAHLLAMQNLLKRRMADAKRDQGQARARLAGTAADLDRLAGLPDLALALDSARHKEEQVKEAEARIPALERFLERRAALGRSLDRSQARSKALAGLAAPAEPAPTAKLSEILQHIRRLGHSRAQARARGAALASLAPAPEVLPATPVAEWLKSRNILEAKLKMAREAARKLARLQACPSLSPSAPLAGLVQRMAALRAERERSKKAGEACGAKLRNLRDQIRARLDAIGVCPTCGAGLELARFLQEAS